MSDELEETTAKVRDALDRTWSRHSTDGHALLQLMRAAVDLEHRATVAGILGSIKARAESNEGINGELSPEELAALAEAVLIFRRFKDNQPRSIRVQQSLAGRARSH